MLGLISPITLSQLASPTSTVSMDSAAGPCACCAPEDHDLHTRTIPIGSREDTPSFRRTMSRIVAKLHKGHPTTYAARRLEASNDAEVQFTDAEPGRQHFPDSPDLSNPSRRLGKMPQCTALNHHDHDSSGGPSVLPPSSQASMKGATVTRTRCDSAVKLVATDSVGRTGDHPSEQTPYESKVRDCPQVTKDSQRSIFPRTFYTPRGHSSASPSNHSLLSFSLHEPRAPPGTSLHDWNFHAPRDASLPPSPPRTFVDRLVASHIRVASSIDSILTDSSDDNRHNATPSTEREAHGDSVRLSRVLDGHTAQQEGAGDAGEVADSPESLPLAVPSTGPELQSADHDPELPSYSQSLEPGTPIVVSIKNYAYFHKAHQRGPVFVGPRINSGIDIILLTPQSIVADILNPCIDRAARQFGWHYNDVATDIYLTTGLRKVLVRDENWPGVRAMLLQKKRHGKARLHIVMSPNVVDELSCPTKAACKLRKLGRWLRGDAVVL